MKKSFPSWVEQENEIVATFKIIKEGFRNQAVIT